MNTHALTLLRSYMFCVGSNHKGVKTIKEFLNSQSKVPVFDLKRDFVFLMPKLRQHSRNFKSRKI